MGRVKGQTTAQAQSQKIRPALTPDAREKQLISLAVDVAEEQLLNRTASSAVVVHYLKLASQREQLERERLQAEIKLQEAKIQALESTKRIEELYSEAITAMRRYSGQGDPDDY